MRFHGWGPQRSPIASPVWFRFAASLLLVVVIAAGGSLGPLTPVRAQRPAGRQSTHPVINGLLLGEIRRLDRARRRLLLTGQRQPRVDVEITSTRDVAATIRSLGGTVESDVDGRVTTAQMPADRVTDLARQQGVATVYPSAKFHLELDRSVPEIRATQAWTLSDSQGLPVQGSHVLIGIVDSGIDYRNADFRNPDGSTRIKYIWDQTQGGMPPAGYTYGYECDADSINSGACPERDTDGHGTHVAGIAAGNGLSSNPPREIGVAPKADIMVVKSDLDGNHIIDAWKYLVDKAQQLGEPIVINNSFGAQEGPHDGSEPTTQALDALVGPGRIFVKSAGNAAGQGAHVAGTVAVGGTTSAQIEALSTDGTSKSGLGFDLFYAMQDSMAFTITDMSTGESFSASDQYGISQLSKDDQLRVSISPNNWDDTRREVSVGIASTSGKPLHGQYLLQIKGLHIADSGHYDAWMQDEGFGRFAEGDNLDTLSIPGDAHNVITVADYATRTTWTDKNNVEHSVCELVTCTNGTLPVGDIDAHSSQGPTADGRQKPDIAAPGMIIISSLSADASIRPQYITPDGKNFVLGGTSMASPHVSGVIALMLQVNPLLDENSVDTILRLTARHDEYTGSAAWTPDFGAGKVDAYAAVRVAMAGRSARIALGKRVPDGPNRPAPKPCKKGYELVQGTCEKAHS